MFKGFGALEAPPPSRQKQDYKVLIESFMEGGDSWGVGWRELGGAEILHQQISLRNPVQIFGSGL